MGQMELLNNLKGWGVWDFYAYRLEKGEGQIVIDILEKQKAKELLSAKIGTFTVSGVCPVCGKDFLSARYENITHYCRYCGQRIDWKRQDKREADNEK